MGFNINPKLIIYLIVLMPVPSYVTIIRIFKDITKHDYIFLCNFFFRIAPNARKKNSFLTFHCPPAFLPFRNIYFKVKVIILEIVSSDMITFLFKCIADFLLADTFYFFIRCRANNILQFINIFPYIEKFF